MIWKLLQLHHLGAVDLWLLNYQRPPQGLAKYDLSRLVNGWVLTKHQHYPMVGLGTLRDIRAAKAPALTWFCKSPPPLWKPCQPDPKYVLSNKCRNKWELNCSVLISEGERLKSEYKEWL